MKNNKLKHVIFGALAASSILINSNAIAAAPNTIILGDANGRDAGAGGEWKTDGVVSKANDAIAKDSNIIFGAGNKTLEFQGGLQDISFGYLNAYGNISKLNINGNANSQFTFGSIINNKTDAQYIADATKANGPGIIGGGNADRQIIIDVSNQNTLILSNSDVSGLNTINLNGAAAELNITANNTDLTNVNINGKAAGNGIVNIQATDVTLGSANNLAVLGINGSATLTKDLNATGTSIYDAGTLTINNAKLTSSITPQAVGKTTNLFLNKGIVEGKVGDVNEITNVTISGGANSITNILKATNLVFNAGSELSVTGAATISTKTEVTGESQLTIAADSTTKSLVLNDKSSFTLNANGKTFTVAEAVNLNKQTAALTLDGKLTATNNFILTDSTLNINAKIPASALNGDITLNNSTLNITGNANDLASTGKIALDENSQLSLTSLTFTPANIDGIAAGQGAIILNTAKIGSAIGQTNKVNSIEQNGDGELTKIFSTVNLILNEGQLTTEAGGTVDQNISFNAASGKTHQLVINTTEITAPGISINAPGTLELTGDKGVQVKAGAPGVLYLTKDGDKAVVKYSGTDATFYSIDDTKAIGATISQQINQVNELTATSQVSYPVQFTADGTLNLGTNALQVDVTTTTDGEGTLNFEGNQEIVFGVGAAGAQLKGLNFAKDNAVINVYSEIYAPIALKDNNQILNLKAGSQVQGITDTKTNATVNVFSGTTVLDTLNAKIVTAEAGTTLSNVNATGSFTAKSGGVTFTGDTYNAADKFTVSGINYVNNADTTTFTNLVTDSSTLLDASNGDKLKFTGAANTLLADDSQLKVKLQNSAIDMDDLGKLNFIGDINITPNNQTLIDTTKTARQILDINDKFNLVLNVADQDVANKIKIISGNLTTLTQTYDPVSKIITVSDKIDRDFFDSIFAVPNQDSQFSPQAANYLQAFDNPDSDTDKLIGQANAVDTEPASKAISQGISIAHSNIMQSALSAPAAGEVNNGTRGNIFVMPFVARAKTKTTNYTAGSTTNIIGSTLGAVMELNEGAEHLGISFSLARATSKFKDFKAGDKSTGLTKAITLFADLTNDKLFLQGLISGGITDFKNTENRLGTTYTGKYQTTFFNLMAKAGYKYKFSDTAEALPYLAVDYDTFRDAAYDLKSDGVADIKVSSRKTSRVTPKVGIKVSNLMALEVGNVTPFVDVSLGYAVGSKSKTKAVDLGNLVPNATYSNKKSYVANVRLGAEMATDNGVVVSLLGGLDMLGKETRVYSGSLKLAYNL